MTAALIKWISGREENDCKNEVMINLHESMGRARDGTTPLQPPPRHQAPHIDIQGDVRIIHGKPGGRLIAYEWVRM